MQETQQQKILSAFQLVLRPIIKILLRYGIGYAQFAETVKTAFVDVSSTDFGIRGRPTNISRIAVMTGLTRKEIRRIRTKLNSGIDSLKVKSTPISEILHRWHTMQEFLDPRGRPSVLPFVGGERSFSSLVKKYGGDVPPGAMRTELKRVGSVTESSFGDLTLEKRAFWPSDQTEKLLTILVHSAYPLLSNIAHNTGPDGEKDPFAQYCAYSVNIRKSDKKRLGRMCQDRLMGLAESFDDMFSAYETVNETSENENIGRPVVVGLYFFDERDDNSLYEW